MMRVKLTTQLFYSSGGKRCFMVRLIHNSGSLRGLPLTSDWSRQIRPLCFQRSCFQRGPAARTHLRHWNAFGKRLFMERARKYNAVQPQTTHSKNHLLHLAYAGKGLHAIFRAGNVAWPFNFPWHFKKKTLESRGFCLTWRMHLIS